MSRWLTMIPAGFLAAAVAKMDPRFCSRPLGSSASAGQATSPRTGAPIRVPSDEARATRLRTTGLPGSTSAVAATSASAYGRAHRSRPRRLVTSRSTAGDDTSAAPGAVWPVPDGVAVGAGVTLVPPIPPEPPVLPVVESSSPGPETRTEGSIASVAFEPLVPSTIRWIRGPARLPAPRVVTHLFDPGEQVDLGVQRDRHGQRDLERLELDPGVPARNVRVTPGRRAPRW